MTSNDSTMNQLLRIRDLADGKYIMTEYEIKTNNFGASYIITCEDENNNEHKCWSNLYMYRYLAERKPKRKLAFYISEGKISIPGYESKVVLS